MLAAYSLLLAAWVFGNPPFRAPDEDAHYLRAVGLAGGQLAGEPAALTAPAGNDALAGLYRVMRPFTRAFEIPAGLHPRGWGCNAVTPEVSAACLHDAEVFAAQLGVTYVGTYQPLPYLLPGLAARRAEHPSRANRLARMAAAAVCLTLLAGGVLALWTPRAPAASLAGPLVALTPMVLFVTSAINPSGVEVASAFAFGASLLALTRGPVARGAVWALAGASGVLLVLARSSAPAWLAAILALVLLFAGPRRVRLVVDAAPRRAAAVVTALGAGAILNRMWSVLYEPLPEVGAGRDVPEAITRGLRTTSEIYPQLIAGFNHLEFTLPPFAYAVWTCMWLFLAAAALVVGRMRERLALLAAAGATATLPIAVWFLLGPFFVQGRYLLPLGVLVPVLAGETLVRNRERLVGLPLGGLVAVLALGAAGIHSLAWYWNARRFAVGTEGPLWFFPHAEWAPKLGWWPWFALVLSGSLLLVAAAILPLLRRDQARGSAA